MPCRVHIFPDFGHVRLFSLRFLVLLHRFHERIFCIHQKLGRTLGGSTGVRSVLWSRCSRSTLFEGEVGFTISGIGIDKAPSSPITKIPIGETRCDSLPKNNNTDDHGGLCPSFGYGGFPFFGIDPFILPEAQ